MRSDAARNRARILDAARDLVAAQGPEVSMDAIASAAGVAVGTLYRHHPTKADLVAAVVEDSIEHMAELAERAAGAVADGADPAAEVAGLFRAVAERYATDRLLKSALSALGDPMPAHPGDYADGSAARRTLAAVESLLGAAERAGVIRPGIGFNDIYYLLAGAPDAQAPETARKRYVDIVLAGLLDGGPGWQRREPLGTDAEGR
jgi:AcrR family transcriptional regulator